MSYTVAIDATDTLAAASSEYYGNGERGLQLVVHAGPLGDDDNTAAIALIALDDDGGSQECLRFEGIPAEDTTILMLYPGITQGQFSAPYVLPYKYQLTASNALGLPMQIKVTAATLP